MFHTMRTRQGLILLPHRPNCSSTYFCHTLEHECRTDLSRVPIHSDLPHRNLANVRRVRPRVEPEEVEAANVIKDANGNVLKDGDDVVVIKDLPVKGMPKPVKAGTKVKNIRLVDGSGNAGHDIDCKIDGFGAMGLKSIFVRKA